MNKKAQLDFFEDINWGVLGLAILGGFIGAFMAGRMEGGIFLQIVSGILSFAACYFLVLWIANKD